MLNYLSTKSPLLEANSSQILDCKLILKPDLGSMANQKYDLYPAHNHDLPDDAFDRKAYNERLELDAERLFSTSDIDISIACRDGKTRSATCSPPLLPSSDKEK